MAGDALAVAGEHAFGEFELDRRWRHAMGEAEVEQALVEPGLVEVERRGVDRDGQSPPALGEAARFGERGVEDPFGQRGDEGGLFGQRHEFARRDRPHLRVVPAQQRFGADADAGSHGEARLEVERQLVGCRQRRRQVGQQAEGTDLRRIDMVVVKGEPRRNVAAVLGGGKGGA